MHPEASTDDFAHERDLAISRRMRAARATGAAPKWSNAEPLSTTPIILENVESMPPSQFDTKNEMHPPKAGMLATGAIYGGAVAALLALIFVLTQLLHTRTYKY